MNPKTSTLHHALILIACLPLLAGCLEPAYVVTVFLEADTEEDHTYTISVLQGGDVVESRTSSPPANFPFHNVVMSPSVAGSEATVQIEENGVVLGSTKVRPQDCSSGEVAVTIHATDAGATLTAQCN